MGSGQPWLDEETGDLHFDDLAIVIGPRLRHTELQAHPDAARFTPFVSNPPHVGVQWSGTLDATPMGGVLYFHHDVATRVSLTLDDPEVGGTSWSDYDPERARRAHDEWLTSRLGAGRAWHAESFPLGGIEYQYDWGTIGSFLHPQDMGASMSVSYER